MPAPAPYVFGQGAQGFCCQPEHPCGVAPGETQVLVHATPALCPVLPEEDIEEDIGQHAHLQVTERQEVIEVTESRDSLNFDDDCLDIPASQATNLPVQLFTPCRPSVQQSGTASEPPVQSTVTFGGTEVETFLEPQAPSTPLIVLTKSARRRQRHRLTNVDNLDPLTKQLVSFESESHLLRASRRSTVMRRCAAIFSSKAGSATTWAMSQVDTQIDVFISHNWSVHRVVKFLVLALHFNFHFALLVNVIAVVIIAAATSEGFVPLVVIDNGKTEQGICGTLLVAPIFLFSVCFSHEFRRLAGGHDHRVFLDKTCIHQSDKDLQRAGILKLGAFIKNSSRMVIVYTDIYLKKLWTVYEVACFLSLHPRSEMVVYPVSLPLLVLGATAGGYSARMTVLVLRQIPFKDGEAALFWFEQLTIWLSCCIAAVLYRHMAQTRLKICSRLTRFQAEECLCADENDRSLVYGNIALLMRATGEVSDDASDELAIATFNRIVRKRLLTPLTKSVAPRYVHCIAIYTSCIGPYYIETMFAKVPFPEGQKTRQRLCIAVWITTWTLGSIPFVLLCHWKWYGFLAHLSGWREGVFLLASSVFWALAVCGLVALQEALLLKSVSSDVSLAGLTAVLASVVSFTVVAFRREQHLQEEDEEEDDEECYEVEEFSSEDANAAAQQAIEGLVA